MHLQLLFSLLPLALAGPTGKRSEPAPLIIPRGEASRLIANEYIVKLKEGSGLASLQEAMKILPGQPDQVFESIFKGFSGKLDASTLEALRAHPDVDYIEQNANMRAFENVSQQNAPWGLGRISHVQPGSDTYTYDASAGEGTCAYIIDSGLDEKNEEFGGRASEITSFIGGSGDTCGHGTHVAGTIGSNSYGVAKKINLYGIKVLNYNSEKGRCEGPNTGVVSGMEYIAKDAANRQCPKGIVVNMSLGGEFSQATNDAAAALVKQGYFVAVAAGNGDEQQNPVDAKDFSPASEPTVCTIGATDSQDNIARFSNYGSAVALHGPGVGIKSVRVGGGSLDMDGTSMASPHIAGLGAYFLGLGKPAGSMCEYLQGLALNGTIKGVHSGTKNLLAQNGVGA